MIKNTFISFTTAADGSFSGIDGHSISGLIDSIELFCSGLDALADLTVSVADTGSAVDKPILTLTNTADVDNEFFVREVEHDNVGGDLATYAQPVAVGKIKIVVTDGGNLKSGKVIVNYHSP